MSGLASYVEKQVLLVTQDGRVIVGELRGYDPAGSLILSDSVERIFSLDEPVEEVPLGLYVVRGDAVLVVGELDTEKDRAIDLSAIRAEPLPPARRA